MAKAETRERDLLSLDFECLFSFLLFGERERERERERGLLLSALAASIICARAIAHGVLQILLYFRYVNNHFPP